VGFSDRPTGMPSSRTASCVYTRASLPDSLSLFRSLARSLARARALSLSLSLYIERERDYRERGMIKEFKDF
jgi:hypothetical protein